MDLKTKISRDPAIRRLKTRGFQDTHQNLPLEKRATSNDPIYGDQVWDSIWITKGVSPTSSGVCPKEKCAGPSDHLPIWTVLTQK